MSYAWRSVPISSIFEADDGSAVKQINTGATAKSTLRVTVGGCQEPPVYTLDQSKSWTITIVAADKLDETVMLDMWPIDVPDQTVNPGTAARSWSIEFRER